VESIALFLLAAFLLALQKLAEERIRVWGGNVELPQTQETGPSENIAAPILIL